MQTISFRPSTPSVRSLPIGKADFIVVFNSSGTTRPNGWIYLCLTTSRRCATSSNTTAPHGPSMRHVDGIVPTQWPGTPAARTGRRLTTTRRQRHQREIQQVVGSSLCYGRAIDSTILPALNSISAEQSKATERTRQDAKKLLDYLATHPDAVIRHVKSDMILHVNIATPPACQPRNQEASSEGTST